MLDSRMNLDKSIAWIAFVGVLMLASHVVY